MKLTKIIHFYAKNAKWLLWILKPKWVIIMLFMNNQWGVNLLLNFTCLMLQNAIHWIFRHEGHLLAIQFWFIGLLFNSEQQTLLMLSYAFLWRSCPCCHHSLFSWHLSILPQAAQQSFASCVWTMRLWLLMEFRLHTWTTPSGRIKLHLPCKPVVWPWTFAAMATRVRWGPTERLSFHSPKMICDILTSNFQPHIRWFAEWPCFFFFRFFGYFH